MEQKCFAILGGNKLLKGICDKLQSYGYYVVVVDWNEKPAVVGDLHIQHDVKDSEGILRIFKERGFAMDGAISCIDLAAPSVSAIHKEYGLKYMPEKYNTVLNKVQMATDWKAAGIFNRISERSDMISLNEVIDLNKKCRIIIKPDVAASSRGITTLEKNSTKEQIEEALKGRDNFAECGQVLRSKGIVEGVDGTWIHFDYVPGEPEVREGTPEATGMICVIGVDLEEDRIRELILLD